MIVPPSLATAPSTSALGPSSNDNDAPSLPNLLMAAAEMHRQGRLRGKEKEKPSGQ